MLVSVVVPGVTVEFPERFYCAT